MIHDQSFSLVQKLQKKGPSQFPRARGDTLILLLSSNQLSKPKDSSCIIINDKEQELTHLRIQNWNVFCKVLLGKRLKGFSIIKIVKLIFFFFQSADQSIY